MKGPNQFPGNGVKRADITQRPLRFAIRHNRAANNQVFVDSWRRGHTVAPFALVRRINHADSQIDEAAGAERIHGLSVVGTDGPQLPI